MVENVCEYWAKRERIQEAIQNFANQGTAALVHFTSACIQGHLESERRIPALASLVFRRNGTAVLMLD